VILLLYSEKRKKNPDNSEDLNVDSDPDMPSKKKLRRREHEDSEHDIG
jgi:hypothetical protein